ncbi:hypothetical protein Ancab_018901 [Ancistrocladus abbreviatus]
MAVVLGNVTLLAEVAPPRTIISDQKIRQVLPPLDVVFLNLPKRDSPQNANNSNCYASFSGRGLEYDGEGRNHRVGVRGKVKSKVNAIEFDANSSDEENGNGESEEEEEFDWEAEMRRRMKEIEEMRELEKKAEELQGRLQEENEALGVEETEEEKKMRVRKELEKVAKEQAERRATAKLMFELGQKAYGKGMYGRAIEFFEGALTIIPRPTLLGGEIQIWLAMAYEAKNRHADCIALYQQLEKNHPSVSIRRQAADLRYIMQAPKIKITQEEMVTIPLIGSPYDSYAGTWTDKHKDRDGRSSGSVTNQLPSTRDYLGDFLKWKPPVGLEKTQVFWAAVTLWLGLVGAALFLQR